MILSVNIRRALVLVGIFFLASCGSTEGSSNVTAFDEPIVSEAQSAPVTTSPPSAGVTAAIDDDAELVSLITAYGECIGETTRTLLSYRTDPFLGVRSDVFADEETDTSGEEALVRCEAELDFERLTLDYRLAVPVTPVQEARVVDEYIQCLSQISENVMNSVNLDLPTTLDNARTYPGQLLPTLEPNEVERALGCTDAIVGPGFEFGIWG